MDEDACGECGADLGEECRDGRPESACPHLATPVPDAVRALVERWRGRAAEADEGEGPTYDASAESQGYVCAAYAGCADELEAALRAAPPVDLDATIRAFHAARHVLLRKRRLEGLEEDEAGSLSQIEAGIDQLEARERAVLHAAPPVRTYEDGVRDALAAVAACEDSSNALVAEGLNDAYDSVSNLLSSAPPVEPREPSVPVRVLRALAAEWRRRAEWGKYEVKKPPKAAVRSMRLSNADAIDRLCDAAEQDTGRETCATCEDEPSPGECHECGSVYEDTERETSDE